MEDQPTSRVSETTFVVPELASGKLSILDAWDLHARQSPSHVLYTFPDTSGGIGQITWLTTVKAFYRSARLLEKHLGTDACSERPVVAMLSGSDSITYLSTVAGLLYANCIPFAISTRNSPQAVAHLIQKTGCRHVLVSEDPSMLILYEAASKYLQEAQYSIQRYRSPTYEDMFDGAESEDMKPTGTRDMDAPALIIHSSGSTSFPKPVVMTHRILVEYALGVTYGDTDLRGHIFACHALPPFHALGVLPLCWATSTGLTLSTWRPQPRIIVSTSANTLEAALATNSTMLLTTPLFIEQWSQNESILCHLQSFKHIIFSGAPLAIKVGDMLSSKGVSLVTLYGSSETGLISLALPNKVNLGEWNYFKLSPHVTPAFKLFEGDEAAGVFESIVISTEKHTLALINMNIEGRPAYNIGDLLARHPANGDLWRVHGRADDQIMLATGEKTNPVPIEAILMRSPYIGAAVMFGRGRFQSGVLVEPAGDHRFDPCDAEKLAAFKENIWPAVEEANAFAPQHSRIFKEMILVASPDKPLERTPKGTVRRAAMLITYDAEINAAYEAVENGGPSCDADILQWDMENVTVLVKDTVKRVVKTSVGDDDDLFQFGCDSLQATYIRNGLLRTLRQNTKGSTDIPFNFVYQNPSITSLSRAFLRAASSISAADSQGKEEEMLEMVASLVKDFPDHQPALPGPAAETILLTGSTGGLGTYTLAQLLQVSSIERVFVLNRAGPAGSRARQLNMLKDRGVDLAVADDARVMFLEGDTTLPGLGLASEVYEEVRTSVTSIIHNAWKVDFNLALKSFRPNAVGVRNLIDTALASPFEQPPRMIFISSISVAQNWPDAQDLPEGPLCDPHTAVGGGYGESKWVSERILHAAAEKTALKPVVVRVGQVCGGRNGAWSVQEWFPSLVKSSKEMGCIPRGNGAISWVPAHTAAAAIVDFRASPAPYVHLVHPTPAIWNDIVAPLAARLEIAIVPYAEWLARLERLVAAKPGSPTPAAKILDFFRATTSEGVREVPGVPTLETTEARRVSMTMEALKKQPIGQEDAERWLEYWAAKGYIKV